MRGGRSKRGAVGGQLRVEVEVGAGDAFAVAHAGLVHAHDGRARLRHDPANQLGESVTRSKGRFHRVATEPPDDDDRRQRGASGCRSREDRAYAMPCIGDRRSVLEFEAGHLLARHFVRRDLARRYRSVLSDHLQRHATACSQFGERCLLGDLVRQQRLADPEHAVADSQAGSCRGRVRLDRHDFRPCATCRRLAKTGSKSAASRQLIGGGGKGKAHA